jgi:hypothetical protein
MEAHPPGFSPGWIACTILAKQNMNLTLNKSNPHDRGAHTGNVLTISIISTIFPFSKQHTPLLQQIRHQVTE